MRYRTFLTFNALGGILWGSVVVVGGYLAGASYQAVADAARHRRRRARRPRRRSSGLVVWRVRRRRVERVLESEPHRLGCRARIRRRRRRHPDRLTAESDLRVVDPDGLTAAAVGAAGQDERMDVTLAEVVAASRAVAATRSRTAKTQALADLFARCDPAEVGAGRLAPVRGAAATPPRRGVPLARVAARARRPSPASPSSRSTPRSPGWRPPRVPAPRHPARPSWPG